MKKFIFILLAFVVGSDIFAADIILGNRGFKSALNLESTGDTPNLNNLSVFGVRFFRDWQHVGIVLNTTIGAYAGKNRIAGVVRIPEDVREAVVEKINDRLTIVPGESLELEQIVRDITIDVNQEVPEVATMMNLELGIKLHTTFAKVFQPYIATGFYSTSILYNSAEFDPNNQSTGIKNISKNVSFMDSWYAYGIAFDAKGYLNLTLEQKVNLSKNVNFGGRQVNFSSSETNLIFNFGF